MRSGRAVYFDEEDEEDEDGGVGGVGVGVVDCSGKNEAISLLSVIMNDEFTCKMLNNILCMFMGLFLVIKVKFSGIC